MTASVDDLPMPSNTAAASLPGPFACVAAAWTAHEKELRTFLRHQVHDEHAAEDLLQDVFVKAMHQGEGFCRLENPRAWLFQVARHALIDRARLARPQAPLDEMVEVLEAPLIEGLAPVDALADCVARVLGELSAQDADILRACDLQGMTQPAFALRHGLSLSATKARLLRARQRMRAHLSAACQVRFDDTGSVAGHVPRQEGGR